MASQPLVLDTSCQPDDGEKLAAQMSLLEVVDDQPKIQEAGTPTHRSHDPQFNQKRSDPFQFGSRYLQETDDVFEFNAWDHVETDDTYKEYAEQQYAMQRESPVSDFDKCKSLSSILMSVRRCLPVARPREYDDLHHKHSSSELSMKTTLYFIVFRPHLIRLPKSFSPSQLCDVLQFANIAV